MKILNLETGATATIDTENIPEENRLIPENPLDLLALTAFCIQSNCNGVVWTTNRQEDGSISVMLDTLVFGYDGFAKTTVGIQPAVFDPMTFIDQESVHLTFWVSLTHCKLKPEAFWLTSLRGFQQTNIVGYPIVF